MNRLLFHTGLVATTVWSCAALAGPTASLSNSSPRQPIAPEAPRAAPQTVADMPVTQTKPRSFPISVSALSFIFGPSVTDPTKTSSVDDSIGSITGLKTRHQMNFRYQINKKTHITPVVDFDYQLTDPNAAGTHERQFRWRDCFVKFGRAGLVEKTIGNHAVALDSDLRMYLPTGKTSRENGNIGGLRLSLNPSVQFGHSNFSISMTNYARYWIQTESQTSAGRALPRAELYTGPQLNYQVNNRMNAFFLYEAQAGLDTKGAWNVSDYANSNTDIEPGMDIKLHDRVTVTPFLNWYTNQRLSTTTMNLSASINLL